jgi:hypothetical protein
MQVDTAQLRKAAARLRQDVAKPMERSQEPGRNAAVDGVFDLYTTAAPFREAATAWAEELEILLEATAQLADALERAADDYDKSDAAAARRMTATR